MGSLRGGMRKALVVPTFTEFLHENKQAFKEIPWMAIMAALTLVLWYEEAVLSFSWFLIPVPFPRHWFPEWVFFAQMGSFLAGVRKTIVPPWAMAATLPFFALPVTIYLLGFGLVTGAALTLLITSPLPVCFMLQKVIAWRKACDQESKS